MTVEQMFRLREELKMEVLRELKKSRTYPVPYTVAHRKCDDYFFSVQLEKQHFGARMICEDAARQAFKERHRVRGSMRPSTYIQTEADAEEYFSLYQEFLSVYQKYLSGSEMSGKEKANERHKGF